VTQPADVLRDLAARQLTTLARFGALGHLDLDLIGAGQVLGRDAKTARGHLLDARTQAIAVLQGQIDFYHVGTDDALEGIPEFDRDSLEFVAVTCRVFAAFAGVALAVQTVHGDRQ